MRGTISESEDREGAGRAEVKRGDKVHWNWKLMGWMFSFIAQPPSRPPPTHTSVPTPSPQSRCLGVNGRKVCSGRDTVGEPKKEMKILIILLAAAVFMVNGCDHTCVPETEMRRKKWVLMRLWDWSGCRNKAAAQSIYVGASLKIFISLRIFWIPVLTNGITNFNYLYLPLSLSNAGAN